MRTVVAFANQGSGVTVAIARGDLQDRNDLGRSTVIDLTQVVGDDPELLGKAMTKLLTEHPPVKEALGVALAKPPNPLYFDMKAVSADALPWESIYVDGKGFCALSAGWPVGRIVTGPGQEGGRVLTPPLRLVAVLSAVGCSGVPQVEALLAAIRDPGVAAVQPQLHVISGEDAVLAAAVGPGVTAERIAGSEPALVRQIAAANPDLLHLLCHGMITAGVRKLAFATSADTVPGLDPRLSGIPLPTDSLLEALRNAQPWLVVLSACETAAASGDGPALAGAIAAGGVPAVIGMRRLFDLNAADRFTELLYPELLRLVVAQAVPGEWRELDWAFALTAPRQALAGLDPTAADSWTDPVLYAQDSPLLIFTPPVGPVPVPGPPTAAVLNIAEARGELTTWRGFLASLDPVSTPPGLFAEVQQKIAQLEQLVGAGDGG